MLTQFDYIDTSLYTDQVSQSGTIDYSTLIASYPYLRAALYEPNVVDWCRDFVGIENCLYHDDATLDDTFECVECTTDYYLSSSTVCTARSGVDYSNCEIRYID